MTLGVRGICYNLDTNSVLLIKHTYSEGWAFPGGGIEVGESMLTALKRELREEVGLRCKSAKVLGVYHNRVISRRDHVIICLVEDWQEVQAHKRHCLEIKEAAWVYLG